MTITLPIQAVIDLARDATADSDALAEFDALPAGRTLLLVTPGRPQTILATLRKERAGTFEWTPLDESPDRWEVQVQKRDARRGALRRITEALGWDHLRLDALDQAATESWDAGEGATARRLHLRFVFGLLRHMRFEEGCLFPAFERISGIDRRRGPTEMMRVEHRVIESLLEDMKAAASRGGRVEEPLRAGLRALLFQHDGKEEKVVYTVLDRALSARESDEIVFRFQAMDPIESSPAGDSPLDR